MMVLSELKAGKPLRTKEIYLSMSYEPHTTWSMHSSLCPSIPPESSSTPYSSSPYPYAGFTSVTPCAYTPPLTIHPTYHQPKQAYPHDLPPGYSDELAQLLPNVPSALSRLADLPPGPAPRYLTALLQLPLATLGHASEAMMLLARALTTLSSLELCRGLVTHVRHLGYDIDGVAFPDEHNSLMQSAIVHGRHIMVQKMLDLGFSVTPTFHPKGRTAIVTALVDGSGGQVMDVLLATPAACELRASAMRHLVSNLNPLVTSRINYYFPKLTTSLGLQFTPTYVALLAAAGLYDPARLLLERCPEWRACHAAILSAPQPQRGGEDQWAALMSVAQQRVATAPPEPTDLLAYAVLADFNVSESDFAQALTVLHGKTSISRMFASHAPLWASVLSDTSVGKLEIIFQIDPTFDPPTTTMPASTSTLAGSVLISRGFAVRLFSPCDILTSFQQSLLEGIKLRAAIYRRLLADLNAARILHPVLARNPTVYANILSNAKTDFRLRALLDLGVHPPSPLPARTSALSHALLTSYGISLPVDTSGAAPAPAAPALPPEREQVVQQLLKLPASVTCAQRAVLEGSMMRAHEYDAVCCRLDQAGVLKPLFSRLPGSWACILGHSGCDFRLRTLLKYGVPLPTPLPPLSKLSQALLAKKNH